jgi:hypothetical protein
MRILIKTSLVLFISLILFGCVENRDGKLMRFYYSLQDRDIVAIKNYLESGSNPDYSSNRIINWKFYWGDRNPLWMILFGEKDDIDLEIIKLLIDFGANVNLRPYIWHALDHRILTEENITWMQAAKGRIVTGTTVDLMYKKIELLIQAGTDVNRKGAPNRQLMPSTEKNYQKYFAREGSRPINYAIIKNLPTIVDLLSQYTILDEESLNAVKLSGDPLMIEKINNMWEKQRGLEVTH